MAKYFPLFVSLQDKNVVIVGGGAVAARRATALVDFNCNLLIVSPVVNFEIEEICKKYPIKITNRTYRELDLEGAWLVIAATSNRETNQRIGLDAHRRGVFVSVADAKEECNFFFPGIASKDSLVVGVTSSGENHGEVKRVTEKIREFIREEVEDDSDR